MTDRRGDAPFFVVVRIVFSLIGAGVGIALLFAAGDLYGKPSGPFVRHREPVVAPRVSATGTLRESGTGEFPPLCLVTHERLERCGKSSCWKPYESFPYSRAEVVVEDAAPSVPSVLKLSTAFVYEPWQPPAESSTSAEEWKTYARQNSRGFSPGNFGSA